MSNSIPTVEKLLTYRETAKLLNVTERTVWSLVKRGTLPAVRFGKSVRIEPADVRAFVDKNKKPGSTPEITGKEVNYG